MSSTKDPMIQKSLRLPASLWRAIEKRAKRDRYESPSSFLRYRLTRMLRQVARR